MSHPRRLALALGIAAAAALALFAHRPAAPLIVYAGTPSVPIGFYLRTAAPVGQGSYVLIDTPAALRAYTPYTAGEHQLIKPVIAAGGTLACARDGGVAVGDAAVLPRLLVDRENRKLPQFLECRRLAKDELFLASTRIPDSLDSRYFGPVHLSEVLGVYRPLWTPRFLEKGLLLNDQW